MAQEPPQRPAAHYSGLLPQKGWPQRNYKFFRHRIVPGMFRRPDGATQPPILLPPTQGSVRVTWIGHAAFFIQFEGHSLMVDPNWANWHGIVRRRRRPGLPLQEIPELDLVLVTHAHFDHLHKPSLKVLQSREGIVVPRGSGSLVRRLGFPAVHEVKVWEQVDFGEMSIVHTPSHHWGARYLHDTHRDYGGYLIQTKGKSVFHCGDSAWFDGFGEIGRRFPDIDVALMPIGAYEAPSGRDVHMNPEEAVRAFAEMGAKVLIPMHHDTFPLGNEAPGEAVDRLLQEADRLGISEKILIPEEGVGIEW
ncbi:L-ascorbate metabolism protein UlaG (beta-lactamase superfamily) [Haloferula luteola]|uniref:L-ascorbate metabolism protein UlaG (Beta-lactamase superfamily) n=1 Tax=Haloferula luteola TaxID=595692 RepID=A0A840V9P2_9BACT|nr:MBL fold metallo-hydrolase [Haloferula luteola]MBB5353796.1 L-ascorbate metabolism protein UlaG (beta-lactamase superfamily) [Haloferula luteola]